jgi:hypothetical protein
VTPSWLSPEQDRALYRELLNVRPTTFRGCSDGPTAAWMALERERVLWALAVEDETAAEDVA